MTITEYLANIEPKTLPTIELSSRHDMDDIKFKSDVWVTGTALNYYLTGATRGLLKTLAMGDTPDSPDEVIQKLELWFNPSDGSPRRLYVRKHDGTTWKSWYLRDYDDFSEV